MLKKRIIFTLLYDSDKEFFYLSRNFNLQKVGNYNWLSKNYNFDLVSQYIDELIVLDVSRSKTNINNFCKMLKNLSSKCFLPIAANCHINNENIARSLLLAGADKLVINTSLIKEKQLVHVLKRKYGRQCIVGSIDTKNSNNGKYKIFIENGKKELNFNLDNIKENLPINDIGELYINSIDKDGTGQDYDYKILDNLPILNIPIIFAGGAGNPRHIITCLKNNKVDAAATAHLFNFIGNSLEKTRQEAIKEGINLANWD